MKSTSGRGWQKEPRDNFPLSEALDILWGRRVLVAGVGLTLVVVALLFGLSREPVYVAEAVVSLEPRERLGNTQAREDFVKGVQGDVVGDAWLRAVMRRAGWGRDAASFRERLDPRIVVRGDEVGLRVRFTGTTPDQAARAANAYADLFVSRVERLNAGGLAGGTLAASATVERGAVPPQGSNMRLFLYAVAAIAVGVLAGTALAFLLENRSRGWRDVRHAELTLQAPVLGVIPEYSSVGEED